MPRGPKCEKRPADVIGNAVHVMRVATGEMEENLGKAPKRAKAAGEAVRRGWRLLPQSNAQKIAHAAAAERSRGNG